MRKKVKVVCEEFGVGGVNDGVVCLDLGYKGTGVVVVKDNNIVFKDTVVLCDDHVKITKQNLNKFYNYLKALVEKFKITTALVENVFHVNKKVSRDLSILLGICMLVFEHVKLITKTKQMKEKSQEQFKNLFNNQHEVDAYSLYVQHLKLIKGGKVA